VLILFVYLKLPRIIFKVFECTRCGISQISAAHFVGHILGNKCSNRETCARRNLCKE
jgi:hypothetical protein